MEKIVKQLIFVFLLGVCTTESMAQSSQTQSKQLPSWAPDSSCMQEYERTTQHSTRCKEQLLNANKRVQEESIKCANAMQKVYDSCGTGKNANELCYKKSRPELNAACSGM